MQLVFKTIIFMAADQLTCNRKELEEKRLTLS